jgi:hypothetical protein
MQKRGAIKLPVSSSSCHAGMHAQDGIYKLVQQNRTGPIVQLIQHVVGHRSASVTWQSSLLRRQLQHCCSDNSCHGAKQTANAACPKHLQHCKDGEEYVTNDEANLASKQRSNAP